MCGEIDALKACLNAGADISLADVNGASPLHFASQLCGANYEGKSDKASEKLALEVNDCFTMDGDVSSDVTFFVEDFTSDSRTSIVKSR